MYLVFVRPYRILLIPDFIPNAMKINDNRSESELKTNMETCRHRSAMLPQRAQGTRSITGTFYGVISACLFDAVLKSDPAD